GVDSGTVGNLGGPQESIPFPQRDNYYRLIASTIRVGVISVPVGEGCLGVDIPGKGVPGPDGVQLGLHVVGELAVGGSSARNSSGNRHPQYLDGLVASHTQEGSCLNQGGVSGSTLTVSGLGVLGCRYVVHRVTVTDDV